jgi:NAD-dependent SIR2 family protein deacetylase
MRFLTNGPDIPRELITLQEQGRTIFVCGAGVSRTIGLPLFRGLVEGVYEHLGEDWRLHIAESEGMKPNGELAGQYDRVLRSLERRLAASDAPRNRRMRQRIRTAVRHVLAPPAHPDLSNHLALLELSRDADGRTRLLTTNFDTMFERAWFERHAAPIASYAGTAMPQPKVAGFVGVLHLHGRLADPRPELSLNETDLVLTSAEFGDAYLRSGWASRYVYDLVRADTVVLVGYQADDPPMRYLLEALEADRERYSDLQKVYAFASCTADREETVRELWRAKGVEPILYTTVNGEHTSLYESVREWCRYAEDPTAWRRERLRPIFEVDPAGLPEETLHICADLLSHGDATQLLGELSPPAVWLPVLAERRVLTGNGTNPGVWIAKHLNDPDMIRACGALDTFDDQTRWHISRANERERADLSPVRLRAWQLMLNAKRPRASEEITDSWYIRARDIRNGEADFEARRLVSRILRPQLKVSRVFHLYDANRTSNADEQLGELINVHLEPYEHPPPKEIVQAWPAILEHEVPLFRRLDRDLTDALEEAHDLGFVNGWSDPSRDVPSVADHPQNAYRSGFYPITRVIADIWTRIGQRDADCARRLVLPWTDLPYLLTTRLRLFALAESFFPADEAAVAVLQLDDKVFWIGDAQVEVMRLLVYRWLEFSTRYRTELETRLRGGVPRGLFPQDAFENEEEWISVHDSSRFKRLQRLIAIGAVLSDESNLLLREIAQRHPRWQASPGDRDDFNVWHETRYGPEGHPELLAEIADESLVREAIRLQQERHLEEGDVWRVFCSADPDRALRGLRANADGAQWNTDAWRSLIWAAIDRGDTDFQFALTDLLLRMPEQILRELSPAVTSWLQRRREDLSAADRQGGPRLFPIWDRLADLTYVAPPADQPATEPDRDILTSALNEPGGILAWVLLDALSTPKPERGSKLGPDLAPRFTRAANAAGRPGLLARAQFVRAIAYLDAIDSAWTEQNLQGRLMGEGPERHELWKSFSQARIPSARLFNALKPFTLGALEHQDFKDHEYEGFISNLLSVAIWHQRGEGSKYELTVAELKAVLTVGPSAVRKNVSWNLWRIMGDAEGEPVDKAERWRTVIGPVFVQIWPLDASLRSESTTRNLVHMALDCDNAFPQSVEAVLDVLMPYQLYSMAHSLRLEDRHNELVRQFPVAFVKLTNALVDPARYPVPDDLGAFLQECVEADPNVVKETSYVRLFGLRRQRGA